MPAEKMTLEQIGQGIYDCGCADTRWGPCVTCREGFTLLRAADAELARGKEAEALLRRCATNAEKRHGAIDAARSSSDEAIVNAAMDANAACVADYKAVLDWLAAHPAKEDGR